MCQRDLFRKCSQSRMPPHISSSELGDATILRTCYVSCTGFMSDDESNTRSHVLFISHCQAREAHVYVANDINLIIDSSYCLLRSASARTCVIPRTQNSYIFGNRNFSAAGLYVCNSLSSFLHQDAPYRLQGSNSRHLCVYFGAIEIVCLCVYLSCFLPFSLHYFLLS